MELISIQKTTEDNFLKAVDPLRKKTVDNAPSLDEITCEVELVRAKRHAKNKGQGYY